MSQSRNPLFSTFKTDQRLEREGVWIEYGPNSKGQPMRILIARAGGANEEYTKGLEVATRPYRKAIQARALAKATQDKLYLDVFVGTVVKGWENMENQDCEPLDYTPENVTWLFGALPDLYEDLQEQANRIAIFREDLQDADVGNSGKS